jgi:hypothetical protein
MSKDFLDKTSGKFEVVHEKKKKKKGDIAGYIFWCSCCISLSTNLQIPPHPQPAKKGRTFPLGGRKIMIGIANSKL